MANENDDQNEKPHDKGIFRYTRDFVNKLVGVDPEEAERIDHPVDEGERTPRQKGVVQYAKDFVNDLVGVDSADEHHQKDTNPNDEPREQGILGYTKNFAERLIGRDDDDEDGDANKAASMTDIAQKASEAARASLNDAQRAARSDDPHDPDQRGI